MPTKNAAAETQLRTDPDDEGAVADRERFAPPGADPGEYRHVRGVPFTAAEAAAIAASDEANRRIGGNKPRGPKKAPRKVIGWALDKTPYTLGEGADIPQLDSNIEARAVDPKGARPRRTPGTPWWIVRQSVWHDPAEWTELPGRGVCQRCHAPRHAKVDGVTVVTIARERLWLPLHRPWEWNTHWCDRCAVQVDAVRHWMHVRLRELNRKAGRERLTKEEGKERESIRDQLRCAMCRQAPRTESDRRREMASGGRSKGASGSEAKWWRNEWACHACWKKWTRDGRPTGSAYDEWARARRMSQEQRGDSLRKYKAVSYNEGREIRQDCAHEKLLRLPRTAAHPSLSRDAERALADFQAEHEAADWREELSAFRSFGNVEKGTPVKISITTTTIEGEPGSVIQAARRILGQDGADVERSGTTYTAKVIPLRRKGAA